VSTSPDNDSSHDATILLQFCTALQQAADTPAMIKMVAGNADFVRVCRHLASPPNKAYEIRFLTLCSERRFDAAAIHRRVLSISQALRLNPAVEALPQYYRTLGVPANADEKAIKHAFREKAKVVHPDRQTENKDAFLELQTAYHHLGDPRRRHRYDQAHQGGGKWIESAENPMPPQQGGGYGRLFGIIGALSAVLMAAAFILDLFYNETSIFNGPEPAAPATAMSRPERRPAANPAPSLNDQDGRPAVTPTVLYAHQTGISPPTQYDSGAADPAAPLNRRKLATGAKAAQSAPHAERPQSPALAMPHPPAAMALEPAPVPLPAPVRAPARPLTTAVTKKHPRPAGERTHTIPRPTPQKPIDVPSAITEPAPLETEYREPVASTAGSAGRETRPRTAPARLLEARLQDFFDKYCKVYASRDLEKFRTFFTRDAIEQGRPIESMLPVYQETFSIIKTVDYAIRIRTISAIPRTGRVKVDGQFQASYELQGGRRGTSSGTVLMELTERDERFQIKNLEYFHN
jgi:curved DNA-binding protein CbpA